MYAATRASTPGTIATERLRSGRLSVGERNALRAARDRSDADIGDRDRVDERIDEHDGADRVWKNLGDTRHDELHGVHRVGHNSSGRINDLQQDIADLATPGTRSGPLRH